MQGGQPQSQLYGGVLLEKVDTKGVEKILTTLENSLAMVGPGFMKKLAMHETCCLMTL